MAPLLWKPHAVLFSFFLFLCFCGLYTYLCSTVYRATLPELPIPERTKWGVNVVLVLVGSKSFHGEECSAYVDTTLVKLQSEQFNIQVKCATSQEAIDVSVPDKALASVLENYRLKEHHISSLVSSSSTYTFFFLEAPNDKPQWVMGPRREGWIRCPKMELCLPTLPALVQRLLLPQAAAVHEPLRVPAVSSYTLSFTLLNARPSLGGYTWEIEEAINRYLSPFFQMLSPAFELLTDSQVLNFADLSNEVKFEKQKNVHTITAEKLREFVGNTRWNVVSPLSTNSIELLVFVPPSNQRPLLIKQGAKVYSPSFIVPRWGGVFIFNELPNTTRISAEELAPAMKGFISQLRIMIGLSAHEQAIANSDVIWMSGHGITQWELDALLRSRLLTYLHEITDTLQSLYELLEAQTHMPVTDLISESVKEALEGRERAVVSAVAGEYSEAMASARTASKAAKSAFFHPSLMPLLYFPDEHLYAVYAPFFMPVIIPIFSAIVNVAKKRIKGKAKTE